MKKIEQRAPKGKKNPFERSGPLTKLSFGWLNELIWVSRTTPWTQDMNYNLCDYDKVKKHKNHLVKAFETKRGIGRSIVSVYRTEIAIFCTWSFIQTILTSQSQKYSSEAGVIINDGSMYKNLDEVKLFFLNLGLSILLSFVGTSFGSYFTFRIVRCGLASKASSYSFLLDKIMKFSPMNSNEVKEGYITNLVQVDAVKLGDYLFAFAYSISSFITCLVGFYYIVSATGWSLSLGFFGVMLMMRVVFFYLYYLIAKIKAGYLKAKDARMGLFTNVLENVEYIKINGFEDYFSLELYELRESELGQLRRMTYVQAVFQFFGGIFTKCPSLVMILLLVYAFPEDIGYKNYLFFLQVAEAFNNNLTSLFSIMLRIVDVGVSLRRINKFLLSREIDLNNIKRIQDSESKVAIEVQNGDFKWRFSQDEENLGLDAPTRQSLYTMDIRTSRKDSLLRGKILTIVIISKSV